MTRRVRHGSVRPPRTRISSSQVTIGSALRPSPERPAYHLSQRSAGSDPIQPVRIRHEVDEFFDADGLEASYNYIVYEFERSGIYLGARTYIDEIGTVSLFGPFKGEENRERVSDPEMVDAVVAYMKRRFHQIDRLGDGGYETIWRRPTTASTTGKPRRGD